MPREKISMLQTRIGEMQRSLDEASQLLDPKPLARRQLDEIRELQLDHLTPLEALVKIQDWQKQLQS